MNQLLPFIVPLLFYVIPTTIGRAIVITTTRNRSSKTDHLPFAKLTKLGWYFALGAIIIFGLALVFQYGAFFIIGQSLIKPYFFMTVMGFFSLAFVANLVFFPKLSFALLKRTIPLFLLIIFLSLTSFGIWLWKSPFPLNWDLYQHQALATYINQGTFSFFTSEVSDTFGFASYPPLFHVVLSLAQFPIDLNPLQLLQFWQSISFLHLLSVSLASFLVGYAFTKRYEVGILSCIIGTLTFESVIAFTSLFFLPQTLAAVVFIFLYSHLLLNHSRKLSWLLPFGAVLFLALTHYIVGGLAALIYLASFCYFKYPHLFKTHITKWLLALVVIVISVIGLLSSYFVSLSFINRGEASFYMNNLVETVLFLKQIYGYMIFLVLPLGLIGLIRDKKAERFLLFLLCFGFLTIIFSRFPYVFKFYTLGRFFLHVLMAMGLWWTVNHIWSKPLKLLATSLVTTSFVVILILNSLFWKQGLYNQDIATHVSDDDLAAAEFLRQNYADSSALIISEPATQFILEGLSGVNSPAGAFASAETRTHALNAFQALYPLEAYLSLLRIEDLLVTSPQPRLLVIGGRVARWITSSPDEQESFNHNIWKPSELPLETRQYGQKLLENTDHFGLVYENPSYLILEVK